ncbi:ISL3 family transposase [Streptomyces olivochromogenes]|uniref:ISL3 family transposase n=1 Tax=Streptomyces olivochromogenes TaxID=1963 RepID=A0A250VM20_STROL|nr:ISL3 family transposase [Streptomyces olivochromogenes]
MPPWWRSSACRGHGELRQEQPAPQAAEAPAACPASGHGRRCSGRPRRRSMQPHGPRGRCGVDEFVFREGCAYGAVLVGVEAGRVVEGLPDHTSVTFAAWLKDHPGVETICRDRASTCTTAVKLHEGPSSKPPRRTGSRCRSRQSPARPPCRWSGSARPNRMPRRRCGASPVPSARTSTPSPRTSPCRGLPVSSSPLRTFPDSVLQQLTAGGEGVGRGPRSPAARRGRNTSRHPETSSS